MSFIHSVFADMAWLDHRRVKAYSLMLLGLSGLGFVLWLTASRDLIDPTGKPIGTDFLSFYAASKLALAGQAAEAWFPASHAAAETEAMGRETGYSAFFYPPPYLIICWPLGLFSYGYALALWSAGTFAAAMLTLKGWVRKIGDAPQSLIVLLAFPAIWINLGNGQNAALMTAIAALGCLWLDKRPWAAGAVLGLLIIKPQLAIALPFVLLAAGRWRTVTAMAASAGVLCLASWMVFPEAWPAFIRNAALARATLEQGLVEPYKMMSVFAALRLWQAALGIAYGVQALWAGLVLITACVILKRYRPDAGGLAALMVTATLMTSPFLLDYDLMLMAIPLSWLILTGLKNGFLAYEKITAFVAYLLPMLARNVAHVTHIPLTPFVLLGLFCLIARRLTLKA